MIKSRHTELRAEMVRNGYTGQMLADALEITTVTLSRKLCGKVPFTGREMYQIMDLFNLPYYRMHIFFPKNGISDPSCYVALPTDLPMRRGKLRAV